LKKVETGRVDRGNNIGGETFRTQLSPLLLIASIFLLNFTARIIASPLLPTIEKDLGFSHGDAGSLFLFLSIGYFISLLGSGHISSRITHRKTIAVSAVAVGTALSLISFSTSLFAMRFCVFLLGIAAGTYLPSGITTVTSLVNPKNWGKAVAIHELAPNLSFLLTPLLAETLLHWFIWRNILFFVGMVSIIMETIMVSVFLITGILTLLIGMVSTRWIAVLVFLQPVLAVCFYPAGFAALSTISTSENRNMAISLTIPVAFVLGGGVVPAMIGIMADKGYFSLGISFSGAMIMTGFFLSFFLKLSDSR